MKKFIAVIAVAGFLAGCATDEAEKPKEDWSMFDQLWTHVSCMDAKTTKSGTCQALCGGEDKTYIVAKDKRKCKGKTYKKGNTNGCYCSF